jgi:RNA polymerase sigma-70 factor, ECF subfamily
MPAFLISENDVRKRTRPLRVECRQAFRTVEHGMPPHPITGLLNAWSGGDDEALAIVTPLVHAELRQLARRHMRRERQGHSLQVTGLVNECYLRLVDARRMQWQDRAHFLAWSSRLMRRILVDFARERQAEKRGADFQHVAISEQQAVRAPGRDLVALDDALEALARIDERKSHVVELRFFGGLSTEEVAEALGVSTKTVLRDWQLAKMWLLRELADTPLEAETARR